MSDEFVEAALRALRDVRNLETLVAYASADLSEEQACALTGTDPVTFRCLLERARQAARNRWVMYRCHQAPVAGTKETA